MFILKKKHEELILKAQKDSYNLGYLKGKEDATEELECGFKNTLREYNNQSMRVREENAQLAMQVRRMDDMICANLQDIESKRKVIKRLEEKVEYLEQTRGEAYELIREFRNERDEINEEANTMVAEREKKIDILKFFLRCRYDKDTARYEAIAKRTKNARIRKKAETKILELKEQKLAFE